MKIDCSIVVPLMRPIVADQPVRGWWSAAVGGIASLSGKILCREGASFSHTPIEVEVLADKRLEEITLALWRPIDLWQFDLLHFSSMFQLDLAEYVEAIRNNPFNKGKDIPAGFAEDAARHLASNSISEAVGDLLLALNIALPGSAYAAKRYVFVDGEFRTADQGIGNFGPAEMVDRASKRKWPEISPMPVAQAYDWLVNIPGLLEDLPRGQSARAVAAYAHLLSSRGPSPSSLMWALMGLEALYVKGSGIKDQLLRKSEVFLGPRTEHKRVFSRMYDLRSRFVHGDVDLTLPYIHSDSTERFEYEAYKAFLVAGAMLVGSLQKMCSQQLYSLEFDYLLVSSTEKHDDS